MGIPHARYLMAAASQLERGPTAEGASRESGAVRVDTANRRSDRLKGPFSAT